MFIKSLVVKWSMVVVLASSLCACIIPGGDIQGKRDHIQRLERSVLQSLYKAKPSAKQEIASAPGYAVFSNVNVNVIFASASSGYGVVHFNQSAKKIYMKMAELGMGIGLGVKDFRVVFVFHNKEVMTRFVDYGMTIGGHIDAAAKANGQGAAVAGEVVLDGISVYQITETGLALQATIKGTKYWRDTELN